MSDPAPMSMSAVALLACYKKHGDIVPGDTVEAIHRYDYTTTRPNGDVETLPCVWCSHLMNDPFPLYSGWNAIDLTTALAIKDCDRDALYLAGAAGRFAKYIESTGHSCHSIDIEPEAIELMHLRGVTAELADAHDMPFDDDSYPLVVVSYGLLGTSPDPAGLMQEAARVASERVIVTDWGNYGEPYVVQERMEWNGQTQEWTANAYDLEQALAWLAVGGASVVHKTIKFLGNPYEDEVSWVVEVGF